VPELVPREELPSAIAVSSAGFNISRAVGPAAGGLMVAAFATVTAGRGWSTGQRNFLHRRGGGHLSMETDAVVQERTAGGAPRRLHARGVALRGARACNAGNPGSRLSPDLLRERHVGLLAVVAREDLKGGALGFGS